MTALHIGPASSYDPSHGTGCVSGLRYHMIHMHDAYGLSVLHISLRARLLHIIVHVTCRACELI